MALELAGVSRSVTAADYGETDGHIQGKYANILARQPDPVKRRRLSAFLVSREQDILRPGSSGPDVGTSLEAFGFSGQDQERL